MNDLEYLASYGLSGDFGRFRAAQPLPCARGDRVVVRSHRGLEVGRILRPSRPGHASFLPNTTVGSLLRRATEQDDRAEGEMRLKAARLCARARTLAAELALPLEVLDAEVLLDGSHGVLHQLRWGECDPRELVSTLARELDLPILLVDLGKEPAPAEEEHGCGSGGCGSGGCGSCGSGGCGSCGSAGPAPEELRAHFAGLREQMEQRRVPLL